MAIGSKELTPVELDTYEDDRLLDELKKALAEAKNLDRTTVIVVETDPSIGVPGYESWWDVAIAEVSEMDSVRKARAAYEVARKRERHHL